MDEVLKSILAIGFIGILGIFGFLKILWDFRYFSNHLEEEHSTNTNSKK